MTSYTINFKKEIFTKISYLVFLLIFPTCTLAAGFNPRIIIDEGDVLGDGQYSVFLTGVSDDVCNYVNPTGGGMCGTDYEVFERKDSGQWISIRKSSFLYYEEGITIPRDNVDGVYEYRAEGLFSYDVHSGSYDDEEPFETSIVSFTVDSYEEPTAPLFHSLPENRESPTGEYEIQWNAPATGDFTYFTIQERQDDGNWCFVSVGTDNGECYAKKILKDDPYSYMVSGREQGKRYHYRVRACNPTECGQYRETYVDVPVNSPPVVVLRTPASKVNIRPGVNYTLRATASDENGIEENSVLFYANNELLGTGERRADTQCTDANDCYRLNHTFHEEGEKTITVRATDTLNATSDPAGGMIVNVQANAAPVVSISTPSTVDQGQTISLQAAATDTDGSIASVTIFAGTEQQTFSQPPYQFDWTPASAGQVTVYAQATDNEDLTDESARLTVTVNALLPPSPPTTFQIDGQPAPFLVNTTGTYLISWDSVASATEGYLIEECFEGGIDGTTCTWDPQNPNYRTYEVASGISKLFANQSHGDYRYRVSACNESDQGCGDPGTEFHLKVETNSPVAPDGLTSASIHGNYDLTGKFELSWEDSQGWPEPLYYRLEEKVGGIDDQETQWTTLPHDSLATKFATEPYSPGVYNFRLNACNHKGCTESGEILTVNVLPPALLSAEMVPACGENCLVVSGTGIDPDSTFTLTDRETGYQEVAGEASTIWVEPTEQDPTTYVQLALSETIASVLFDLEKRGLRVSVENNNGERSGINAFGDEKIERLSQISSAPAIGVDGTIYVGSGDKVFAVNPEDGSTLSGWPFVTGDLVKATPVVDSINSNIYVGSLDDNLYAISPYGLEQWRLQTNGDLVSSAVLDESRILYQGSMDGVLYAIQAQNGAVQWTYPAGAGIAETPVLAGNGTLYFTTVGSSEVFALGRGVLGPDQLVWESQDDSLLANTLQNLSWQPGNEHLPEYQTAGRLYSLLLQPPLNLSRDILTFWTYALVNGASSQEIANAFLKSDTGRVNFSVALTDEAFVDALYARAFPGQQYPAFTSGGNTYSRASLLDAMSGSASRAQLAVIFAESSEFATRTNETLRHSFDYFYTQDYSWAVFSCDEGSEYTRDCDGDSLPDHWEILFFGDITSESGESDADGDGQSNYQAFLANLDPCANLCLYGASAKEPAPAPMPQLDQGLVDMSASIGSLPGEFRVNESGAATYQIPLGLPAGTAGVSPSLSLNYSSQNGNGLLGHGWALSGLSGITRCRQTLGQDGQARPITWTAEDRFCLDGQRLLAVEGEYGQQGTVYQTEVNSHLVVVSHGETNGEPDYFTVERKDGSLSYYGETPDSKNATDYGTLTWAISSQQDSARNRIEYLYRSNGGHRIEEVRYAYSDPDSSRDTGYGASVVFEYTSRADHIDGYVAGGAFENTQLLKNIHINNSGVEIRRYELEYLDYSADTLSRIERIRQCAGDICQADTVFDWRLPVPGSFKGNYSDVVTLSTQSDRMATGMRPSDINGDGRMDLIWLEPDFYDDGSGKIAFQTFKYVLAEDDGFGPERTVYRESQNTDKPYEWRMIDLNADGRSDLVVYLDHLGYWAVVHAKSDVNGNWTLNGNPQSLQNLTGKSVSFADINGDGLVDYLGRHVYRLLEPLGEPTSNTYYQFGDTADVTLDINWDEVDWDYYYDGEISDQHAAVNTRVPPADFNGDGLVDIAFDLRMNAICDPDEPDEGDCIYSGGLALGASRGVGEYEVYAYLDNATGIQTPDINNDGLPDLLYRQTRIGYYRINNGAGFEDAVAIGEIPTHRQLFDFDNDGDTDIVWHDHEAQRLKVMRWDTIDGNFADGEAFRTTDGSEGALHLFVDMNGDGVTDYVRSQGDRAYLYPATEFRVPVNVVDKITNGLGAETQIGYGALTNSGHYARRDITATTERRCEVAVYGDLYPVADYQNNPWCRDQEVADLSAYYGYLNDDWSGDDRLGKQSPTLELMGPMYVVTQVASSSPTLGDSASSGASATSAISYYYAQAKMQAGGRGLLGFERLRTVDEQTGVETITSYRQDFPFQGYPVSTEVITAEGKLLSQSTNTWRLKNADGSDWTGWGSVPRENGTAALGPLQTWLESSEEKTWSLESPVGAEPLKTVTTVNAFDRFGNATGIETTMVGPNGDTFKTTTANEYDDTRSVAFDNSHHRLTRYPELGRLTRVTVFHERTVDGEYTDETRTSAFTYYQGGPQAGLLETETIEPEAEGEQSNLKLTTRYEYDSYGNKTRVEQTAGDVAETRSSRWVYEKNEGRYLEKEFNVYEQTVSEVSSRNALGLPTAVKDMIGNETQIRYDAFGRKVLEYSPTGAHSITLLAAPSGHCPAGSAYQQTTKTAGGGESLTCFDMLARTNRSATRGFDGNWVYADTQYDGLGRVQRKSEPYSGGPGSAQYWTAMEYDILGRLIGTDMPGTVSNNGTGYDVHMAYDGYTTVTTNPDGYTKTEVKNAKGELTLVRDHLQGEIRYSYDAQGNLLFVSRTAADSGLNPVTEMRYDRLGRKVWMKDPDKGGWQGKHWEYRYNGFGELTWQKDAKDQQVSNEYDQLGRQVYRVDYDASGDVEASALWVYQNDSDLPDEKEICEDNALKDRVPSGALCGVADGESGYTQAPGYDRFGRQIMLVTNLDSAEEHWTRTSYDEYGRVLQQFDASGDGNWNGSVTENRYNQYGYLERVVDGEDVNLTSAATYYTVLAMDERGNVTESSQGNGVVTTRQYDPATGRLEYQSASLLGVNQIQDLTYQWDNLGNLDYRHDQSGGKDLFEDFDYDALNRLKSAQVNGREAQTLNYDGFGNITYKSDVGNYHYSGEDECTASAGPHALCATSDADTREVTATYEYDANGNMTSDSNGRSLRYSTFDKPLEISKDGHTTEFAYGVDRSRYLRVDTDSNGNRTETRYIGNVEKITRSDGSSEVKRYLPGGAVVTIADGEQNTRYLHKDHLGSVDVITDASGSVMQSMSFDAWGQRRNAQGWEALISSELTGFDSSITTRGYTGHEMLDQVGLIHMNGRIYDARLGRFLQADPFVQAATDTQMYNRYSYVRNNPLNATDPSGYFVFTLAAMAYVAAAEGLKWYVVGMIMGAAGFLDAVSQGASFKDALKAGVIQGISAAAFAGIGQASGDVLGMDFGSLPVKVAASGVVGGISSVLQGGKFGHGFASASIGALVGASRGLKLQSGQTWANFGRAAARITIAGTVSKATGGKFGNGAAYAAFAVALEAGSLPPAAEKGKKLEYFNAEEDGAEFQWEDRSKLKRALTAQADELKDIMNRAMNGDPKALAKVNAWYGESADLEAISKKLEPLYDAADNFKSYKFRKMGVNNSHAGSDRAYACTVCFGNDSGTIYLSKTAFNDVLSGNLGKYTLLHEVGHFVPGFDHQEVVGNPYIHARGKIGNIYTYQGLLRDWGGK